MLAKSYLLPILFGFLTFTASKDLLFQLYTEPPFEYCEHEGVYYRDINAMYDAIQNSIIPFRGYEYAYPCYIKTLHVERLLQFDTVRFYTVTYGSVTEIPKEIGSLTLLEKLQIQDQQLNALPSEISQLTRLKVLNLGGNNISAIPSSIGSLTELESLLLFDNALTFVPKEIAHLSSLKVLDLRNNALSSLPEEISALQGLEYLFLGGNPLSSDEQQKIRSMLPSTMIFF